MDQTLNPRGLDPLEVTVQALRTDAQTDTAPVARENQFRGLKRYVTHRA
ncbi:hypothetical protein FTUN_8416 [Frigoriglobus tundricola]|uniref:Uncharacterized protein n=1 Tax=Frigoriglobus tundricola TaxID=2774151 RepID=A0A6M5Z2Y2_9BACT|nr:hypothetical protein FTUN_8416 [Frigoriglobus tundricola]